MVWEISTILWLLRVHGLRIPRMLLLSSISITDTSSATKHRLIELKKMSWQWLMLDRDGLLVDWSSCAPADRAICIAV
jgi:hypothetical protein